MNEAVTVEKKSTKDYFKRVDTVADHALLVL